MYPVHDPQKLAAISSDYREHPIDSDLTVFSKSGNPDGAATIASPSHDLQQIIVIAIDLDQIWVPIREIVLHDCN